MCHLNIPVLHWRQSLFFLFPLTHVQWTFFQFFVFTLNPFHLTWQPIFSYEIYVIFIQFLISVSFIYCSHAMCLWLWLNLSLTQIKLSFRLVYLSPSVCLSLCLCVYLGLSACLCVYLGLAGWLTSGLSLSLSLSLSVCLPLRPVCLLGWLSLSPYTVAISCVFPQHSSQLPRERQNAGLLLLPLK